MKLSLIISVYCLAVQIISALALESSNLSAGKSYQLTPAPNYKLCTGDTDLTDLTDGVIADTQGSKLWFRQGCVGWSLRNKPVSITLDLGKISSFSRVKLYTAGNTNDVEFPCEIAIEVSNDNETFYTAGSLVGSSETLIPAKGKGYDCHVYDAEIGPLEARYIRWRVIPAGPFFFCDEIQVFGTTEKTGKVITELPKAKDDKSFMLDSESIIQKNNVLTRLKLDASEVSSIISASSIGNSEKKYFLENIEKWKKEVLSTKTDPIATVTNSIIPLNGKHKELFKIYASFLQKQGFKNLTLWSCDKFDAIYPYSMPKQEKVGMELYLKNNEFRGVVLNLTNPLSDDLSVSVNSKDLPCSIYRIEYMDTRTLNSTSTVMVPLEGELTIPAGMTVQLYFRIKPEALATGVHQYKIAITEKDKVYYVPVKLHIGSEAFPTDYSLSTGLFDYLDFGKREKSWGIASTFLEQALELEKNYLQNIAFASSGIGMSLKNKNSDMVISGSADFSLFDKWIAQSPGARYYFIYWGLSFKDGIGETKIDAPEFSQKVADWAQAWDRHLVSIGISPEKVIFLLHDEPKNDEEFAIVKKWGSAFKKSSSRILLFTDPVHIKIDNVKSLKDYDIICPHYVFASDEVMRAIRDMQNAKNKQYWIYQCDQGPFSTSVWYFRGQAWSAFRLGATGSLFWALGDNGNNPNGWNQYATVSQYYSPALIGKDGLYPTKHFEALAEGVEDYEYLQLLKNITETDNKELSSQAKKLLSKAFECKTNPEADNIRKNIWKLLELSYKHHNFKAK